MKFLGVTFTGPEIDDQSTLDAVPIDLRRLLQSVNGLIAYGGGLHIRGACSLPHWHSLADAWRGENAFFRHYGAVQIEDVPFAEDAVGDQWLLRDGLVVRLAAETGDVTEVGMDLRQFLGAVQSRPIETLRLGLLLKFESQGGQLQPGQLLNVYPPLCTKEAADGYRVAAVPAEEQRYFLTELARQLPPDGEFEIGVKG